MVDRKARNLIIREIDHFLNDHISAFELDDRLSNIQTEDTTAQHVNQAVWLHYDDITDHPVNLNRAEWNYFQRLILLLRSEAELSQQKGRLHWGLDSILAAASCLLVWSLGFSLFQNSGWHPGLLLIGLISSLIAFALNHHRTSPPDHDSHSTGIHHSACQAVIQPAALSPFANLSQLRWLRQQTPQFEKQRYRSIIGNRRTRNRLAEALGTIHANILAAFGWFFFSPLILALLALPWRKTETVTLQLRQSKHPRDNDRPRCV